MTKFTIHAPLMGYKQTTKRALGWTERSKKYAAFKERVLALAMEAGWIRKAVALKDIPPRLSVSVYWRKNPRIDWKNVYGAIEDALFSDDRFVKPGNKSDVEWDTGKPEEAIVIVET